MHTTNQMQPDSSIYRFFSGFLALSLLLSVSIPAGLHAKGHSKDMDMEMCEISEAHHNADGHDCPMHARGQDKSGHDGHGDEDEQNASHNQDCDLGFACACSVESAPVRPEAIPVLSKIQIELPVSGIENIEPKLITGTFNSTPGPERSAAPPPLFLLNSTFLN
ncbi:MAG: hypothetical protein ACOC4S_02535 [Balneolaceae bacterium]